ncbi:MAG: aminotransferase class V-fold PLP-dependent enzyme [Nitrososphaeria archaeon]|nr:aminotransferase class V-fold PLP-dependent enzyme [Nitrososphaeria archaeon]NIQ33644.1 aminotransferase class V-fold PLP-dependent enzyme [Nitrososphaeria archaeon]
MNIDELRKDFPITERYLYFNTGWSGPSPKPVVEAMVDTLRRESSMGPASKQFLSEMEVEITGLRNELGDLIGVNAEEISLNHSTGEGLNVIYNGMKWNRGDRVVTTNLEHGANILPLMQLRKRRGVEIVKVEANSDGLFDLNDFEETINEKTKLVTISHVNYMLGTILPVKEIAQVCHQYGVPILLDTAQSVGGIQFNLKEIGCDFAAAQGGKWLLGPGGTGFLYIAQEQLEKLSLASIGYRGAKAAGDDYLCRNDARRFEISEPNAALKIGLHRAVKYHTDIGTDVIQKRVRSLTGYLIDKAGEIPKLQVLGARDPNLKNGLVSLKVEGRDANELVRTLETKHRIVTRAVPKYKAIRVSLHIFNTEKEIDTLVNTLENS